MIYVNGRMPRCEPLQHGLEFTFDGIKFPRRYKQLPFCSQHKKSCCKPSDSHRIFNEMKPLIQNNNVSAKCKQLTNEIWCSSCHKSIGTHQMIGICSHYCDKWFNECRNEYYFLDISDRIKPCTNESVVCSKLDSFINNGTDLCIASGFRVNYVYLDCFDDTKKESYKPSKKNIKLLSEGAKERKAKSEKDKKTKKQKNQKKSKLKEKPKQSKPKKSRKEKRLDSIKKKLKKRKQSPVPWLEDTIPDIDSKTSKTSKPSKKKSKKSSKA